MALKELEVKYAAIRSRAYKLTDGGGLHLFVQPNGSKLWRMKYRFAGKEKLLSFGKYPDVPLAAARTKRDEVPRGEIRVRCRRRNSRQQSVPSKRSRAIGTPIAPAD